MFVWGVTHVDNWKVTHDQAACILRDSPLEVSITDFGGQVCVSVLLASTGMNDSKDQTFILGFFWSTCLGDDDVRRDVLFVP